MKRRIPARDRAVARVAAQQLIDAGQLLSNIAFNLKQSSALDAGTRELLDQCQRAWDDAVREHSEKYGEPK
jgi:hypothetical protein